MKTLEKIISIEKAKELVKRNKAEFIADEISSTHRLKYKGDTYIQKKKWKNNYGVIDA